MNCLFCKIISWEIKSEFIFEDEKCIIIKDLYPQAKNHFLIIPKKHIETMFEIEENQKELIWHLHFVASKLWKKLSLKWWKFLFNIWKSWWQEIFHIHLHFLSDE